MGSQSSKFFSFDLYQDIFPHFYVVDTLELNIYDLISIVYEIKNKVKKGKSASNYGGYQSLDNLHMVDSIYKEFVSPFVKYFEEKTQFKAEITSLWANINYEKAFNNFHTHTDASLKDINEYSGVFYLKTPENCGDIGFFNPIYVNKQFWYKPKEKDLILFPSYLPHMVDVNRSKQDRVSLAFNFKFN